MVNRGDSYANLPYYTSYDLAWLAPITYPLALSLVSISFAFSEGWRAGYTRTATNALATVSVAVETFFAILCFIQCILNYSRRAYVGLAPACDFQAWYACFWLFSSIGLQPLVAYVSFGIAKTREQPSKARVLVMVMTILFVALILSFLPIMGAGYYGFPKDYCMFELHDAVMGGIFLGVYFVTLLATGGYHVAAARMLSSDSASDNMLPEKVVNEQQEADGLYRMPTLCGLLSPTRLQILMVVFFLIIWTPTAVVVMLYQMGGREPPVSSTESAWVAITLHSQQLFNPLLVGILWRRWSAEATTVKHKEAPLVSTAMTGSIDSNMRV